jgi:hypothetical protein
MLNRLGLPSGKLCASGCLDREPMHQRGRNQHDHYLMSLETVDRNHMPVTIPHTVVLIRAAFSACAAFLGGKHRFQ